MKVPSIERSQGRDTLQRRRGRAEASIETKVAVVIPCYRVRNHILNVISAIGPEVSRIYVVDDKCPEETGLYVEQFATDPRLSVIFCSENLGVGGAVMVGYSVALNDSADIIVKVDGDGQMDLSLLPLLTDPITKGRADYTKGNRFYDLRYLFRMPLSRLVGNAILSFMSKLSSGYWNVFDPTNGYTAIDARVARHLPFGKISRRYFFESDMLFRLSILRAVVVDIPMDAIYGDEKSGVNIGRVVFPFLGGHARNFGKRIFYNYFLRDMTAASFELILGLLLFFFGAGFGLLRWISAVESGEPTPLGTIMIAVLPVLVGLQLLLAFLNFDVSNVPKRTIASSLPVRQQEVRAPRVD